MTASQLSLRRLSLNQITVEQFALPEVIEACGRAGLTMIGPWRHKVAEIGVLGMRVLAPVLALGNAVVLKPSPETPISGGLLLAELFAAAGLPAGVLQVVPGGVEIGEAIVAHAGGSMVHFTGSTKTGRAIAEVAGRELKHCSLELGADNALVVLDDADVDHAAMIGAWSAYHYQGQTCITAGRHIVARPLFDGYVQALAERAGAITVGDPTDGLFYRPTVVVDVPTDSDLWREEIFAPMIAVHPIR